MGLAEVPGTHPIEGVRELDPRRFKSGISNVSHQHGQSSDGTTAVAELTTGGVVILLCISRDSLRPTCQLWTPEPFQESIATDGEEIVPRERAVRYTCNEVHFEPKTEGLRSNPYVL